MAKYFFEAETGRALSPSQVEMCLINTATFLLSARGNEEQRAFERGLLAYCVGDELDEKGVDLKMPRLAAAGAKVTLRFERVASADRLQVPRGTRAAAGDDSPVQFATLADVWLEAGQESDAFASISCHDKRALLIGQHRSAAIPQGVGRRTQRAPQI